MFPMDFIRLAHTYGCQLHSLFTPIVIIFICLTNTLRELINHNLKKDVLLDSRLR